MYFAGCLYISQTKYLKTDSEKEVEMGLFQSNATMHAYTEPIDLLGKITQHA
jgi:hypothetical protein